MIVMRTTDTPGNGFYWHNIYNTYDTVLGVTGGQKT